MGMLEDICEEAFTAIFSASLPLTLLDVMQLSDKVSGCAAVTEAAAGTAAVSVAAALGAAAAATAGSCAVSLILCCCFIWLSVWRSGLWKSVAAAAPAEAGSASFSREDPITSKALRGSAGFGATAAPAGGICKGELIGLN